MVPHWSDLLVVFLSEANQRTRSLLDPKQDPGTQRFLTPFLGLEMYFILTIPTAGAMSKDSVLKEQGVVDTIWQYM